MTRGMMTRKKGGRGRGGLVGGGGGTQHEWVQDGIRKDWKDSFSVSHAREYTLAESSGGECFGGG